MLIRRCESCCMRRPRTNSSGSCYHIGSEDTKFDGPIEPRSNFDGRIVPRIEVRWTNRTSDRSSMDESSVGSKFDERIEHRIEVRYTNRASNGSSMDESFLGSKFNGRIVPRIEVRWAYQHSENSAPNIVQNGVPYSSPSLELMVQVL